MFGLIFFFGGGVEFSKIGVVKVKFTSHCFTCYLDINRMFYEGEGNSFTISTGPRVMNEGNAA